MQNLTLLTRNDYVGASDTGRTLGRMWLSPLSIAAFAKLPQ